MCYSPGLCDFPCMVCAASEWGWGRGVLTVKDSLCHQLLSEFSWETKALLKGVLWQH